MFYREHYPTCPKCYNESLEMRTDSKGNVFECDYCGFHARIKVEITEVL